LTEKAEAAKQALLSAQQERAAKVQTAIQEARATAKAEKAADLHVEALEKEQGKEEAKKAARERARAIERMDGPADPVQIAAFCWEMMAESGKPDDCVEQLLHKAVRSGQISGKAKHAFEGALTMLAIPNGKKLAAVA